MKAFTTCLLLLSLALPALADDVSSPKAAKVATLVSLMQLREHFADSVSAARADDLARVQRMMADEQAAFSAHRDYEARFQALRSRYLQSLQTSAPADAYLQAVSQQYEASYSSAELDGLIRFYRSPLGQKQLKVNHEANELLLARFSALDQTITASALDGFTADYRKLAAACGCLKADHVQLQ